MEHQVQHTDEISLKELILQGILYVKYCLSKWYVILIAAIIFGILLYFNSEEPKREYNAQVTFTVNAGSSGPQMPDLGGLASTFGLGIGGGGDNPTESAFAFLRTREVMSRVLFSKATVQENNDFLINHCLEYFEYEEKYKKAADKADTKEQQDLLIEMSTYRFKNDSIELFSRKENKLFLSVYQTLISENLISGEVDAGIQQIAISSPQEELSYELAMNSYNTLDEYYTSQTIQKQKDLLDKTKAREDSLRRALSSAEYQLAKFSDKSSRLIFATDQTKRGELERKVMMLSTMYGEAVKNLEMTRYTMQEKTPFIQAVDLPIYPLPSEMNGNSRVKSAIIGALAGALFAIIILCAILFFRIVMADGEPVDI